MAALSWLLIPIAAAVLAGIWGSWATRRRTGVPDSAGVAGYERFRAAMERSQREEAGAGPLAGAPAVRFTGVGGTGRSAQPSGDSPQRPAEPVAAGAHPSSDGPARTAD